MFPTPCLQKQGSVVISSFMMLLPVSAPASAASSLSVFSLAAPIDPSFYDTIFVASPDTIAKIFRCCKKNLKLSREKKNNRKKKTSKNIKLFLGKQGKSEKQKISKKSKKRQRGIHDFRSGYDNTMPGAFFPSLVFALLPLFASSVCSYLDFDQPFSCPPLLAPPSESLPFHFPPFPLPPFTVWVFAVIYPFIVARFHFPPVSVG